MKIKCVEIRDHATCIPALAIEMSAADYIEHLFLWRCGYPRERSFSVVLMHLGDQRAQSDPYGWDNRTFQTAHLYITDHFDEIEPGQVVDVRVLLGEATEPVPAEIEMNIKYPNVTVKLAGKDGNVFAIGGRVGKALKRAGVTRDEISAFYAEMSAGTYGDALATVYRWVKVK